MEGPIYISTIVKLPPVYIVKWSSTLFFDNIQQHFSVSFPCTKLTRLSGSRNKIEEKRGMVAQECCNIFNLVFNLLAFSSFSIALAQPQGVRVRWRAEKQSVFSARLPHVINQLVIVSQNNLDFESIWKVRLINKKCTVFNVYFV